MASGGDIRVDVQRRAAVREGGAAVTAAEAAPTDRSGAIVIVYVGVAEKSSTYPDLRDIRASSFQRCGV